MDCAQQGERSIKSNSLFVTIVGNRLRLVLAQHEHIVLQADEVQVLVEHFADAVRAVRLQCGRRQVFQFLSRDRRYEVEEELIVQMISHVAADAIDVVVAGRHEVDRRHIGYRIAVRVQLKV